MTTARTDQVNEERPRSAIIPRVHSALTFAAAGNNFTEVERLIPTSDVNWQGIFGNTALHWAIANSNTRMALYLLEHAHEINANAQDSEKKTALHLALGKGWYHFNTCASQVLTEPPQAPVIQVLIKKTSLEIQDRFGNTPLHIAIMRRDLHCVEELLKNGARLDITNIAGKQPIDMLDMSFNEVQAFIDRYVYVFSLHKKLWEHNKEEIYALLQSPSLCKKQGEEQGGEEKIKLGQRLPMPRESACSMTPHEAQQEELTGPPAVLFEQANCYVECLLDYIDQQTLSEIKEPVIIDQQALSEIKKPVTELLIALRNLKDETISSFNSPEMTLKAAQALAFQSLTLARKAANCTITPNDIGIFHEATAAYKKKSLLGKALGAIIGAAIGVCIGVMAGMAAGPVAAFTGLYCGIKGAIIGASAGSALGSVLGFWGTRSYMNAKQSLTRLETSATEIYNILNQRRTRA